MPMRTPERLLPVVQWIRIAEFWGISSSSASRRADGMVDMCNSIVRNATAPWMRISVKASTMPCT